MVHRSTSLGDAVAAIVAMMRARTGYRSPWVDGTGIPVYHSVEVGLQALGALEAAQLLIVGDTGDPEVPQEAADSGQRVATLGTRHARDEEGTVRVRAIAQTGDAGQGVVERVWDEALDVLDDLDEELSAAPHLGLVPGYQHVTARFEQVTAIRPYLTSGTVVEAFAEVSIETRL